MSRNESEKQEYDAHEQLEVIAIVRLPFPMAVNHDDEER
jgi:hypothetical protein